MNIFTNIRHLLAGPAVYVHPCVINKQPHIVYPRGLAEQSPELFRQLHGYYSAQGYALKEDQRSATVASGHRQERRRWALLVLFTTSLMFESHAYAETGHKSHEGHQHQLPQRIELQLVATRDTQYQAGQDLAPLTPVHAAKPVSLQSAQAQRIYGTLTDHYVKQTGDPEFITEDFKQIANYYSEFPEVVAMLEAIKDKNWQLSYDAANWVTVASGNVFQIDKAVIHFNTRSAAQLRLNNGCQNNPVCIASPADALLHELLHTHSMLIKTSEFIAQGGMNNVMYPYKHEYAIIEAERKLYASMSRRDEIKRPQRNDHTGRLVKADCPTCIK